MERYEYDGFVLIDKDGLIVAAKRDALIGTSEPAEAADFVAQALAGRATVSRPFPSVAMIPDLDGTVRAGVPTMFAAAPIRGEDGQAVAVLGLRMRARARLHPDPRHRPPRRLGRDLRLRPRRAGCCRRAASTTT